MLEKDKSLRANINEISDLLATFYYDTDINGTFFYIDLQYRF